MVEIVQISDLHYGSEFVPEYMENIIQYITETRPDAVVCTGDNIHKGRVVQFREFLPYLERLKQVTKLM
ncbi:MAG: metallophosphoesterase family protein, partial [Promethearchaeota archaeon]